MPMLDKSKLRPDVLKLIEETEKLQVKGAFAFLKNKENRGFQIQAYLEKIAEYNEKFFEKAASQELNIDNLYGIFTDEELRMLAKFFRFEVEYTMDELVNQHPLPENVRIENVDVGGVPAEWQIVPGADKNKD